MIKPEKNLEEKIKAVRNQIAALDSKREVLEALLEKLENQRAELTGEQYYQQVEPAVTSAANDKNENYLFSYWTSSLLTSSSSSGARGRGFESAEHDVRMPHRTWMYVSVDRIAREKCPDSTVAGRANVLIYLKLNAATIDVKSI
jgi:hypothetical protein